MSWKKWIPAILTAVAAVGLAVCTVILVNRPPVEDRSEALSAELASAGEEGRTLRAQRDIQNAAAAQQKKELAQLEELQAQVTGQKDKYEDLAARWEAIPDRIEAVRRTAVSADVGHIMPPNYDRPCLNKLQTGSKTAPSAFGAIGKLFGGLGEAIGGAMGSQAYNTSQEDVGRLHSVINSLADEINTALCQADQSRAAYRAAGALLERVYDPELTGGGAEGQLEFLERMYETPENGEAKSAMLHDAAYAAEVLRCSGEVYAAFLLDDAERNSFLGRMDSYQREFESLLSENGTAARDCLSQEELDTIYQHAVARHRELGMTVQSCQVWDTSMLRQTSLLDASGRKMLVSCRSDGSEKVMYATDPKDGVTAFYGFDRNGEPMSFTRGDQIILFDWSAKDGTVLYTNMEERKVSALYRFFCFLRDNRSAFRNTQYDQYQTVY